MQTVNREPALLSGELQRSRAGAAAGAAEAEGGQMLRAAIPILRRRMPEIAVVGSLGLDRSEENLRASCVPQFLSSIGLRDCPISAS